MISEEERLKIWAELELAWIQPTPDRGETKRSKIKILMICEENQEINELQDIYFPFKAQSQTSRSVFLKLITS